MSPPSNAELLRRILALAAPTTAVALLQVVAQLVETWLAARQGTAALAGWAVVLPLALLLQQMSTGAMGGGVVSAVARALGASRSGEASSLVLHAMLIATGFGLLFAVGVAAGGGPMLQAVAGDEAAAHATPYALALFGLGAVPAWWANTLASVLRGGGRHALAARVLGTAWLAMPPLSWLLAEPGGFGLAGLGLAFALCFWLAAAVMYGVVQRGGAGFRPAWRQRPSTALFIRILSVGAVASALALVANLATVLVMAQLRHLGPVSVAGYGIAARLEFLVVPLAFGVGSALTALVGGRVGAGDWATARRIAWIGAGMAGLATGLIGAVVALLPLRFAELFTDDAAVVAVAAAALRYTGPAFGAFGLGMALYFAAMGAGRMAAPVAGGLARLLVASVGGWCLANWAGMGVDGNLLADALGISALGLFNALGVRRTLWRASARARRGATATPASRDPITAALEIPARPPGGGT